MKKENKTPERMIEVPEKVLLSLVAHKLKGQILFPEKLAHAKDVVKRIALKEKLWEK